MVCVVRGWRSLTNALLTVANQVHYGAPGGGKSTALRMHEPGVYIKTPHSKWWDGYAGERIVVFNDFSGSWFAFHDLMAILDPFPLQVETKGGHVQLLATEFRISSNYPPLGWYSSQKFPFAALNRRLTKVVHYPYAYPYPLNGAPKVEKDDPPSIPVVHAPSPASSPSPTPPSSPREGEVEALSSEDEHSWINEVSLFNYPAQELAESPRVSISDDEEPEPVAMQEDPEVTQSDEDAETEPDTFDYQEADDDEDEEPLTRRRDRRRRNPFILDEASDDEFGHDEDSLSELDEGEGYRSEGSEAEASDSLE